MPSWILIALIAYLLFAINGVADKFLLSKVVPHPAAYVFYTGIISPFILIFAPFGLHLLSGRVLLVAILSGVCFAGGLYFLYTAIKLTSISRLLPLLGGFVPIFTLFLAYLILHQTLDGRQLLAFGLLVAGAILVSLKKEHQRWHSRAFFIGIVAALLFALSFTLIKYVYGHTNYLSGLIWMRMGVFLVSLCLLFKKSLRQEIWGTAKKVSPKNALVYYGARGAGAAAGLLQQYAISIGSVTIINALQGTQFVFLLGLTAFTSYRFPKILKEDITIPIIIQKTVALLLIGVGLGILAFSI